MTGRKIFSFALKAMIVAIGILFLTLEDRLRTQGVDVVTRNSVARLDDLLSGLTPGFGTSDAATQTQVAPDRSDTVALREPPADATAKAAQPPVISRIAAPKPPLADERCEKRGAMAHAVVPGDVLNVRYFEKSLVPTDGNPDGANTDIVFERLDLSGTFTVGADGAMSLPAVGHVDVTGLGLPCVETTVARAAFDRLGIGATVNAAFASRPQIVLDGAVREPGTYAFTPGLTVARLLALAGTVGSDNADSRGRLVELEARANELQRMAQGQSLMRKRLEAALSGQPTLDLAAFEGNAPDAARINVELMALEAEYDAVTAVREKEQAELRTLDLRIESAERQLRAIERQYAYFSERNEHLSNLLKKGVTTSDTLDTSQIRLMETDMARLEKADLLVQLKAQREMLERNSAMAATERRKATVHELRDLIARQDATQAQIETVVAQLENIGGAPGGVVVAIDRQGVDGPERIQADMKTEIRPGDFVTVSAATDQADGDISVLSGQIDNDPKQIARNTVKK